MFRYANYQICIFMNINENIRNKRKIVKIKGCKSNKPHPPPKVCVWGGDGDSYSMILPLLLLSLILMNMQII